MKAAGAPCSGRADTPPTGNGAPAVNTVSIWRFDTSDGAEDALRVLERLQTRRLVTIDDAAFSSGARARPGLTATRWAPRPGPAALSGAFWGLLFGLLFLLPLAGAAEGCAVLAGFGLTDEFLADVRAGSPPEPRRCSCSPTPGPSTASVRPSPRSRTDLLVSTLDHEQQAPCSGRSTPTRPTSLAR